MEGIGTAPPSIGRPSRAWRPTSAGHVLEIAVPQPPRRARPSMTASSRRRDASTRGCRRTRFSGAPATSVQLTRSGRLARGGTAARITAPNAVVPNRPSVPEQQGHGRGKARRGHLAGATRAMAKDDPLAVVEKLSRAREICEFTHAWLGSGTGTGPHLTREEGASAACRGLFLQRYVCLGAALGVRILRWPRD
jgi:hypothetical protein